MRPPRRLHACQSGAAAVEFAIIAMLLVLVVLGIIELGRALDIRNQLSFAADFGARKILINRQISDGALETEIRSRFNTAERSLLKVTLGSQAVNGIQFRTITLDYPFVPLVPGLTSSGSLNLNVARRAPVV